jgi:hypothetical protein
MNTLITYIIEIYVEIWDPLIIMIKVPYNLEATRTTALKAIGKVRPVDDNTKADKNFLFNAQRTEAGRSLPPYYLVYFLLVELLGFKNIGRFEKIDWAIPIDYEGTAFLIEHRKWGLGIFAHNIPAQEKEAKEIAMLIQKSVKVAQPFFAWKAAQAIETSELNVVNYSRELYERYEYFLGLYEKMYQESVDRREEKIITKLSETAISYSHPTFELRKNAQWLAQATIEAFYTWTEHIFIHIAILQGTLTTAEAVADMAGENWPSKFKKVLDIENATNKKFFDKLLLIRKQLRNFMAHGAFGKEGEAFSFHSGAGAVPVLLDRHKNKSYFSLLREIAFEEADAIVFIKQFIDYLWSEEREPAQLYIQEWGLPIILPMASDGTYRRVMQSKEEMKIFVGHLARQLDRSANMDW